MKRAFWLAGSCVLAGTIAFSARADGTAAQPKKIPAAINPTTGAAIVTSSDPLQTLAPAPALPAAGSAAATPPAIDPTAPIDFSAPVDLSDTDPEVVAQHTLEESRRHQEENQQQVEDEEIRERQAAAAQEDWMLRDYQQRLRQKGLLQETAPGDDPDGILPPRSTGDQAANLANDPLLPHAAATAADHKPPTLEDEMVAADKKNPRESVLDPMSLPPLLPPLNSPDNPSSPRHDYFGGIDADQAAAEANAPATAATPANNESLLDVPGLTAAQQSGLPDEDANSILDDRLPDEPAGEAVRPHPDQNNFMLPTAPLNDIDSFYKKQAAALAPPVPPTFQPPPTLTLPKTYQPPEITAKPVVDGQRNHVADPFDFLNR